MFIQDDFEETITAQMLKIRNHPFKVFLQYLLASIAANCEDSSDSDELLSDGDSECHEAVISDSEVQEADDWWG